MNAVVHELHHVFVARYDVDRMRRLGRFASERADYIVGFEARDADHRNAIRLKRASDVRNLLRQILRHRRAIRFVAFIFDLGEGLGLDVELSDGSNRLGLFFAECRAGNVEHRCQIFGREIVAQLAQHVHENIDRRSGQAGFRGHGPLPRHGVIGAENERHRIDEVDAPLLRSGRRCSEGGAAFADCAAASASRFQVPKIFFEGTTRLV